MREKKDIVFLCQFFHPEYISSAQLPFDTAKALQRAGFSVDVICGYPKEYYTGSPVAKEEILEGIGIHRLRYLQPDRKLRRTGRQDKLFHRLALQLGRGRTVTADGRRRSPCRTGSDLQQP